MFSDLTETLSLTFFVLLLLFFVVVVFGGGGEHCLRAVFLTLRGCDLARSLAFHTRFDDRDLISRLQECQNHKLEIVFRFLPALV